MEVGAVSQDGRNLYAAHIDTIWAIEGKDNVSIDILIIKSDYISVNHREMYSKFALNWYVLLTVFFFHFRISFQDEVKIVQPQPCTIKEAGQMCGTKFDNIAPESTADRIRIRVAVKLFEYYLV